jgi:hypothetical protein
MFKVVAAIVFVLLAGASYAYTNPPYEYYPYVAEDGDKPPLNYTKVCLPGSRGEKSASYVALGIFYPHTRQAVAPNYEGDLVIPETIDGLPVRRIMPSAFLGCQRLKSVKIPSSVREIGDKAFAWCLSLERVEIGEGVRSIGAFAFSNCVKIASITLPSSLAIMGPGCFARCNSLMDVRFNGNAPRLIGFVNNKEAPLGEKYFMGNDAPNRFRLYIKTGTLGWKYPYSNDVPERWPIEFGYDRSYEVVVD